MKKNIAVLAGDGIGVEVMQQSLRVLDYIAKKFSHQFTYHYADIGGAAYEKYQRHCPDETLKICQHADAILFGSVGGRVEDQHLPKWHNCETNSILKLRDHFKFNINIRPIRVFSSLTHLSPLREEIINAGIDILIFRELNGDLYFGKHEYTHDRAMDEAVYTKEQINSIAHAAFKAAQQRKNKLISVDKANVLATSKLWRQTVSALQQDYSQVTLTHMLVDNCAMQLILHPQQFDVMVTTNMFGDILSDLAAALPGSVGLIPSISMNAAGFALYEPSGGSAPDIAGKNSANPIAQILSAALMLRHSFALDTEAEQIETAVKNILDKGIRTKDLARNNEAFVSTSEFTDILIKEFNI